ncbi:exonuclease SbcC, partial [Yersinia enterocolitica]
LKKPRSDSRDIQIKNNKKKEANYFSQVILSQDAIDRFLREAKPQDRYSQFMNHFGDASEITRQKITAHY